MLEDCSMKKLFYSFFSPIMRSWTLIFFIYIPLTLCFLMEFFAGTWSKQRPFGPSLTLVDGAKFILRGYGRRIQLHPVKQIVAVYLLYYDKWNVKVGSCCIAQSAQRCDDLRRVRCGWGEEVQEGRTICTHIADSHCLIAETNTTL